MRQHQIEPLAARLEILEAHRETGDAALHVERLLRPLEALQHAAPRAGAFGLEQNHARRTPLHRAEAQQPGAAADVQHVAARAGQPAEDRRQMMAQGSRLRVQPAAHQLRMEPPIIQVSARPLVTRAVAGC